MPTVSHANEYFAQAPRPSIGEGGCVVKPDEPERSMHADLGPAVAPQHRLAVSLAELSSFVGVDRKTLRHWSRERGMPTYRIGRRILVVVPEFLEWLRVHRDHPERDLEAEMATMLERMAVQSGSGNGG